MFSFVVFVHEFIYVAKKNMLLEGKIIPLSFSKPCCGNKKYNLSNFTRNVARLHRNSLHGTLRQHKHTKHTTVFSFFM